MITDFELLISIKNQTNLEQIPLEYLRIELQDERTKEIALNKMFAKYEDGTTKSLGSDDYIQIIERQINIVNAELSRLEMEKEKATTKGENSGKRAVSVCIGNVQINKPTFEKMLTKMNELIFDDSSIDQWECIIKNTTPATPIKVKKSTSIIDLRLFFDLLSENEIFESEYLTPLINLNAFFLTDPKQNKILKYEQLTQAKKDINKKGIKPQFSIDDFLA